ncbi:MAG: sulfotransferase domain-containing protein [Qipengyuania sp.]|uniref:sulfotransferase domain-containing protein n=1 Tax=Qipengyuania sp. TaxID=2004515 RepID=UPI003001EE11
MTPDFLIIGAMKAGTTTLFRDLEKHPAIFVPGNKEPHTLSRLEAQDDILAEYARLFAGATTDKIKGEASTGYTKRPDIEGVPDKAHAICGPDLKLIYLRRRPETRIVSQYRHEREHGTISEPFSEALRKYPRLIDYSRYDWQLAPWIAKFGEAAVFELDLEKYSARRAELISQVLKHIGADPGLLGQVDLTESANRADEAKAIKNRVLRSLVYSNFYQDRLKNLIPAETRARLRRSILPAPKTIQVEVSERDRAYIAERLAEFPG